MSTIAPEMATNDAPVEDNADVSIAEQIDVNAAYDFIQKKMCLISPSLSIWQGRYQIMSARTKLLVGDEAVAQDDITAPCVKLLTDKYPLDANGKPWKKRFHEISAQLSKAKEFYSLPTDLPGIRILPRKRLQAFLEAICGLTVGGLERLLAKAQGYGTAEEVESLQARLNATVGLPASASVYQPEREDQSVGFKLREAADEFCNDWDNIRKQLEQNTAWAQVSSRVPTRASSMRNKFGLLVSTVELAGSGDSLDHRDNEDVNEQHELLLASCREQAAKLVEELFSAPREELQIAVTHLQSLIDNGSKITDKSYAPIYRIIEKVRGFATMGDSQLTQTIDTLERTLDRTAPATVRRSRSASNGLVTAIKDIQRELGSVRAAEAAVAKFGRPARAIRLDTGEQ